MSAASKIALGLAIAAGLAGILLWARRDGPSPGEQPDAPVVDARPAKYRAPTWPPDTADIPGMLRDRSWKIRLSAANALRELTAMSAARRAALLVDVLDREAAAPDTSAPVTGSYVPLTSFLRLQYVGLLEDLGPAAAAAVKGAKAPAGGPAREWRALALAATREREAAPALRPLVTGSTDPAVRMSAAHFLGHLNDRAAIPELRKALSDPATATPSRDAPGTPARTFYPVRQSAAGALRAMGLAVERRGDAYVVK